jgi:hypothetical protein
MKGDHMTAQKAYDEASKVDAIEGEVTMDGPDGVGISMTPAAAAETSKRLGDAAARAAEQDAAVEDDEEPTD